MQIVPQVQAPVVCPTPYDPTPEYGLLAWEGSVEAAVYGAHTATGAEALSNVLLRMYSVGHLGMGGATYYTMPDMSEITSIGFGAVDFEAAVFSDATLYFDRLPTYWGDTLSFASCDLEFAEGNPANLFGTMEAGEIALVNNLFDSSTVDSILAAAVALDGASAGRTFTLHLQGTNAAPTAAGVADAATLSGYGWTVYVSS